MTDEELSTYVAMFASGNADGAVRTLVSEIRRLRAENAELRDDARVGRAVRELEARAGDQAFIEMTKSGLTDQWCVAVADFDDPDAVAGPWCPALLEAVEKAGRG